jgi:pyruvate dehydrogenase E2 component (dihydrolipoamide acetyltransferase)
MAEVIKMPKMSDTMTEGVIAKWHKKVADKVKSGDILAEVETDKATMELESYEDGTLLHIGVQEKDSVPVDSVLAIIGEKGENIDSLLKSFQNGGAPTAPVQAEKKEEKVAAAPSKPAVDTSNIKATVIRMPKMSDTMTEGTIVAWHKKVGDKVKSGDLMAEVATDKATMELESYEDGTLLYIGVKENDAVAVDGILAIVGEAGADYQALLNAQSSGGSTAPKEATKAQESAATPAKETLTSVSASDNSRVKISPLAKKLAEEKGIDVKAIKGSGDNGRIIKKDVEEFKPSEKAATPSTQKPAETKVALPQVFGEEKYEDVSVSQFRKVVAKKVAESKYSAPHFYVTMEINMDKAITARNSINEISPVKVSFNDLVIKAAAVALRSHPKINSSWLGDKIRYNKHINIAVAVAVEDGVYMPVVRFADTKTLSHIAAEVKELGGKAKNKQLQPQDWAGSTFSISNLGMFGVDEFTGIINAPDACILAVGGIKQTPIVADGQIKIGNLMKVTLSCDHRVLDGAVGAAYLQTLKGLLEDPIRLLV